MITASQKLGMYIILTKDLVQDDEWRGAGWGGRVSGVSGGDNIIG